MSTSSAAPERGSQPGLVLVWTPQGPECRPLELGEGLVLGRDGQTLPQGDGRASRRHCRVRRERGQWRIEELGSANGTFVDDRMIDGEVGLGAFTVLRIGHCLLLPTLRLDLYKDGVARIGGAFVGPHLRPVWDAVAAAASAEDHLWIEGPEGAGHEFAARHYHASGPGGPLATWNLRSDRERPPAADGGGVLFLDDFGAVPPDERRALLAAAFAPRLRLCVGIRRAPGVDTSPPPDLAFARVELSPLKRRREEIPWLLHRAARGADPPVDAHPLFVEDCLLRDWPGNHRELVAEVRAAARVAQRSGRVRLERGDLGPAAGHDPHAPVDHSASLSRSESRRPPSAAERLRDREAVVVALTYAAGDLDAAARDLGVSRSALEPWIAKHRLDLARFRA